MPLCGRNGKSEEESIELKYADYSERFSSLLADETFASSARAERFQKSTTSGYILKTPRPLLMGVSGTFLGHASYGFAYVAALSGALLRDRCGI
jgi:hypothetical protein